MSKGNVQALSILAAVNSGIVTAYIEYEDINPKLKDGIVAVNKKVTKAFEIWGQHDKDKDRVMNILKEWNDVVIKTKLGVNPNLTVMLMMSQTACQNLLDYIKAPKKVAIVQDILDGVEDLIGYLTEGIKDTVLIEKIDKAEAILDELFKINGFVKC